MALLDHLLIDQQKLSICVHVHAWLGVCWCSVDLVLSKMVGGLRVNLGMCRQVFVHET